MKVQVSRTMLKELQKNIHEYDFSYVKMTPHNYEIFVDYNWLLHDNDYDYKTESYKVIRVDYDYNDYANPKYITTNDLLREFRDSDKTYNGFMNRVRDMVAI